MLNRFSSVVITDGKNVCIAFIKAPAIPETMANQKMGGKVHRFFLARVSGGLFASFAVSWELQIFSSAVALMTL